MRYGAIRMPAKTKMEWDRRRCLFATPIAEVPPRVLRALPGNGASSPSRTSRMSTRPFERPVSAGKRCRATDSINDCRDLSWAVLSLDHPIGTGEDQIRNADTEGFCRVQIDRHLDQGGLLDGEVSGV